MKKSTGLNAIIAERLFIVAVIALSCLLVANFIFVSKLLASKSRQADHAKIEAEVSNNDIKTIKSAGLKMSSDPDAVKRAELVVAESQLYKYQDQIIQDLGGYAARSGIKIEGYSFTQDNTTEAGATPTASPAPTTTPPATTPVAPPTAPAGVSSTIVNVTLGQQVDFVKFLNFLKHLESNVTRMQVTNITLSPDPKDRSQLANPSLTLMVYKR